MEEEFRIRTYTKAELAHLYNPCMTIPCALRTLSKWITGNRSLVTQLSTLEYNRRSRIYTPKQVKVIVEHLGEP